MKEDNLSLGISPTTRPEQHDPQGNTMEQCFHRRSTLLDISVNDILPNKHQPRKSFNYPSLLRLADSIRRYGILQPITVRNISLPGEQKYEIICGERRYRAGILAGIKIIKCFVIESDELASAELSVIENLLRDDLNMFEQAEAFNLLISSFNLTQEDVAHRVSLSQSAVANKVRLLRFSQQEQQLILEYALTERHARALLRISDPIIRVRFIELIYKDKLNVAASEQLIDNFIKYTENPQKPPSNRQNAPAFHKTPVGIIKDVRLFSNSIEKAADMLRKNGVSVETACDESQTSFIYTITISKRHAVSRETS